MTAKTYSNCVNIIKHVKQGFLAQPTKTASREATLFTNDMAKLSPQLSADVSKTSALELNKVPSIAPGIGMAM